MLVKSHTVGVAVGVVCYSVGRRALVTRSGAESLGTEEETGLSAV